MKGKVIRMAKVSKTMVDRKLRDEIFADIIHGYPTDYKYTKVNDRQYGVILIDANGVERYCRVGMIVAELREDMTAEELMQSEIDAYEQKQADKAEKEKTKAQKIAKDKARREKEKEVSAS